MAEADVGFRLDYSDEICLEHYCPIDLQEEEVSSIPLKDESSSVLLLEVKAEDFDDESWHEIRMEKNECRAAEAITGPLFAADEITGLSSPNVEHNQPKMFSCPKCGKVFPTHIQRHRHLKNIHDEKEEILWTERDNRKVWGCRHCDKTFVSRKGSIIHQRTHTGERPYACHICSKCFIDSSTLMKHQVIHQAVRPFSCATCSRGFNQKVALRRHERTHNKQPIFTCALCPKTFFVKSSLQAHEKLHLGFKPYSCHYCMSSFHTSTALRQHERVHTNVRPFYCNVCKKPFKDSGTLLKHQIVHVEAKPFICPICPDGFAQKMALRKHIQSHVSSCERMTSCPLYECIATEKDRMCHHIEAHVGHDLRYGDTLSASSPTVKTILPHNNLPAGEDLSDLTTLCEVAIRTAYSLNMCDFCGQTFNKKKSLDSHLLYHRTDCKLCSQTFTNCAEYDAHKINHCIESQSKFSKAKQKELDAQQTKGTKKIFKKNKYCEKCKKSFSTRNGFLIHQRSHTGERPFACRWCEKAFGDSATRHKHERIHTGEKPFKCQKCPRAFNQRAALRSHQSTHSTERTFICGQCPSSYLYAATLHKHQLACHAQLTCPLCSLLCANRQALFNHIYSMHSVPDIAQFCQLCESGVFADAVEFCDHLVWHGQQQQDSVTRPKYPNVRSSCRKGKTRRIPKVALKLQAKRHLITGESENEFSVVSHDVSSEGLQLKIEV